MAFQEALDLRRRATEMDENSETMRELANSLDNVGFVQRLTGHSQSSLASHEESFSLRRRLLVTQGETPELLRNLSASLNSVGQLRQQVGDLAGSLAAYKESAAIARRLMKTLGTTPETLRDLSISMANVGMAQRETGSLSESAASYEASVSLRRRRIEDFGDTLRGLPTSRRVCRISAAYCGVPTVNGPWHFWKSRSCFAAGCWRYWERHHTRWMNSPAGSAP